MTRPRTNSSFHGDRRRRFYAIEFVIGMAVLGIVLATFVSYFSTLRRAHTAFVRENRCLIVLDNTLERLRAMPVPDAVAADRLLAEEFAAMAIPGKSGLTIDTGWEGDRFRLAIRDSLGRDLARVEVTAP